MLWRSEQHFSIHEVKHLARNGICLSNHDTQVLMPISHGIKDFASIVKLITFRDVCGLVVRFGLATLHFNVLLDRPLSHLMEQINP